MSRTKRRKKKKKDKPNDPRLWVAVDAWFRNSAGPIPDKKKEADKKACRESIEEDDE